MVEKSIKNTYDSHKNVIHCSNNDGNNDNNDNRLKFKLKSISNPNTKNINKLLQQKSIIYQNANKIQKNPTLNANSK